MLILQVMITNTHVKILLGHPVNINGPKLQETQEVVDLLLISGSMRGSILANEG